MIIMASALFSHKEPFSIKRRRPKHMVQIGVLHNTPQSIKKLMIGLNKIGGQMTADAKYDTVATDYLDKDNIN